MITFIKNFFGFGPKIDYKHLVQNGAVILDVRTKSEFQSGHIKGATNIPVDSIKSHLSNLKKETPMITCCASGMRSAVAKQTLKSNGFKEVYNGSNWKNLENKLS